MICISGAIPEINAESKDLKMQSVNSYQIPNNSTLGLAQVPHGPWRVTTGYHKLNQKVTAVTVPIASMVIFTGTNHWSPLHLVCIYVPIELVNVFFSILINEDSQKKMTFLWQVQQEYALCLTSELFIFSSNLS